MRRWSVLLAGAALWLFLAAIPALADGGPHVAATNSGASVLTADSCAGCHRAHTAQGEMLINAVDEEALCLTCHGASSTGATTDVMTGIQYRVGVATVRNSSVWLGALRSGGFDRARIGTAWRVTYDNGGNPSRKATVRFGPAADVTSSHLEMSENGLSLPGVAWGNGANGSGAGPSMTSLSCASCHNPHGNGQYRILNAIPTGAGINAAWTKSIVDVNATTGVYRTAESHGLLVGDTVTITGSSEPSANVSNRVIATLSGTNGFTLTGVTVAANGAGGTATRNGGVKVADAALPTSTDSRNYTIIQRQASSGSLLYASQVRAAGFTPGQGDYWHRQVPWNALSGSNADAPNGRPVAAGGIPGFNDQITAWCSQCHTRYMANQNPTTDPANGAVANAWGTPRAGGDTIYAYQHRMRNDRACTTCHVSHGSNVAMTGDYSSTFTYPDGAASTSSRLLKVGNRGTCQLCHEPTGTDVIGNQYPAGPIPGTP